MVWFYRNKNTEGSTAGTVALDTKLVWVRLMEGNSMTHPSDVVLDALDDDIGPSGEVLSDHRETMDGRFGVFCKAAELMSVELAELDRI